MSSVMDCSRETWNIEQFDLDELIYEGRASCLFLATHRHSGARLALKCYEKRKLSTLTMRQVQREVCIHRSLAHPNITKLHTVFQDKIGVYLVMELAVCDIFHTLNQTGTFAEQQCKDIILSCLSACAYLHNQGIVHRDIKPENLLISAQGKVKLADFGLSINSTTERPVTRLGTLDYMAPEVMRCPDKLLPEDHKDRADIAYSAGVDIWAVGILAYELMTGSAPFARTSCAETYREVQTAQPRFPSWLSDSACSFIAAALCKDAKQRPSAEQLLRHPWLSSITDISPSQQPSSPTSLHHPPDPAGGPVSPPRSNPRPRERTPPFLGARRGGGEVHGEDTSRLPLRTSSPWPQPTDLQTTPPTSPMTPSARYSLFMPSTPSTPSTHLQPPALPSPASLAGGAGAGAAPDLRLTAPSTPSKSTCAHAGNSSASDKNSNCSCLFSQEALSVPGGTSGTSAQAVPGGGGNGGGGSAAVVIRPPMEKSTSLGAAAWVGRARPDPEPSATAILARSESFDRATRPSPQATSDAQPIIPSSISAPTFVEPLKAVCQQHGCETLEQATAQPKNASVPQNPSCFPKALRLKTRFFTCEASPGSPMSAHHTPFRTS